MTNCYAWHQAQSPAEYSTQSINTSLTGSHSSVTTKSSGRFRTWNTTIFGSF